MDDLEARVRCLEAAVQITARQVVHDPDVVMDIANRFYGSLISSSVGARKPSRRKKDTDNLSTLLS
jgi:hypothetical protein|tara:strand:- start:243 stop:440 length:198 start_codon:yes stop_codon:yes gene_type:complete